MLTASSQLQRETCMPWLRGDAAACRGNQQHGVMDSVPYNQCWLMMHRSHPSSWAAQPPGEDSFISIPLALSQAFSSSTGILFRTICYRFQFLHLQSWDSILPLSEPCKACLPLHTGHNPATLKHVSSKSTQQLCFSRARRYSLHQPIPHNSSKYLN